MSRVVLGFVAALSAVTMLLAAPFGSSAVAQDNSTDPQSDGDAPDDGDVPGAGFVDILEVSGLLDDVVADTIEEAIRSANADGARALVLQVNSKQAVVSDARLNEIALLVRESPVAVSAWVGPSGSRALGKVAQVVGVADSVGVAIGAKLGKTGEQVLDAAVFGEVWGENQELLEDTELTWEQAIEVGIVPCEILEVDELGQPMTPEQALARCANPTVGDFLLTLDGVESTIIETEDGPRQQLDTQVRFRGLSLLDQLMHTVASPPVAYLLLVIGLALVVFEFYSIGIGIAGAIGGVFIALGSYGLAVLPIRVWALVLIVVSFLAFAIDVQNALPRLWTAIGMVLFTAGTIFLYPESDVSMSWIPITVAVVGIGVVMYRGMHIMVRGRFATTEIPRDFLVDENGQVTEVLEQGQVLVSVRESPWRGRADSELRMGDEVQVTGVDGHVLEVERADSSP